MADLECYSVHSVKGGVGKSTVATLTAIRLARETGKRVFLIDMDLTGTSLGDVLPLCAPRWETQPETGADFLSTPTLRWSREETVRQIELRGEPGAGLLIPFLNDFLLFETPDWAERADLSIESISWKFPERLENLHVLCSSALPLDLERTLPVIYDEEHSAFLQHRLEFLLADIARGSPAIIVFDTPPTIPGLSRSVLSLGLRMTAKGGKLPLTPDGPIPKAVAEADIVWRALMLTTLDLQDLRAMARWLAEIQDDEQDFFRVLVNRVPAALGGHRQLGIELQRRAPDLSASPLYAEERLLRLVDDPASMQIFDSEAPPMITKDFVTELARVFN